MPIEPDHHVTLSSETGPLVITPADRAEAERQVEAASRGIIPAGITLYVILSIATAALMQLIPDQSLVIEQTISTVLVIVISGPVLWAFATKAKAKGLHQWEEMYARERRFREAVQRREFETQLANALDMADTEDEALDVTRLAIESLTPDRHTALLLADNSHAHLRTIIASGGEDEFGGCPVESPDRCIAARRGQTQSFPDSTALDACPKLRNRPEGHCGAVCVPVAIAGRTVGVLHVVHRSDQPPASIETIKHLEIVAKQVGGRIGTHRTVSESQAQASTDPLTGLLNRRTLENKVRTLKSGGSTFAVVMADLDRFKNVNDTHGHQAGDRALRSFASVMRATVRPQDLVARWGGEEFVIVLPGTTEQDALAVCERIRENLALASQRGDLDTVTVSLGIAGDAQGDFNDGLERADAALHEAKSSGRNRSVIYSGRDDRTPARVLPI
jgi:diguanylate cyclase (GGDEF)-like protein